MKTSRQFPYIKNRVLEGRWKWSRWDLVPPILAVNYIPSTVLVLRMANRTRKETKQEPGTAGPSNMLGYCLVSFHFLWAILSTSTLYIYCQNTVGQQDECSNGVYWNCMLVIVSYTVIKSTCLAWLACTCLYRPALTLCHWCKSANDWVSFFRPELMWPGRQPSG